MATHDYNIANQTGADFRADLNNALLAIVSNNSNATSPSTTYAYQLWVDTANNVLKLRNSANSDWITTGISITASNSFTGDITGNSATATALATARTINGVSFDGTANISFNTDSVSEGSSNLYFTNERVDDQVNSLLTAGSGISLTYDDAAGTLTIANTNSADITSVVAGNGLTGGGTSGDVTLAVSVDDSSIEINSDTLRVKASGITNAMLAGSIANDKLAGSIANSKLANSSVTINSQAISLGGSHTFDSDDIGEGSSNLYFTNARARGSLSIGSEGSASGNGAITYNSSTGVFTYTPPVISGLSGDTDDLSEGSSNLYYTDARSNAAIDARVTNTFINNLSGVVADTATALATARSIALSGDVTASGVNFDGTGDITLSTTIGANSVALGTDTTGNYVAGISGTTNEIEVSGSGSETASVTIGLPDNVTIAGDLTVNGTTTTVNTSTLEVEDPLIKLAKANSGADSVDIGFYGLYDTSGSQDLYAGLFRDASDSGKFKLFKDLQAEPTTTVNTSGTGYAVGTLVSNLEGDVTGTVSSISNHSTSDLSEGTNLYYTDARFDTRLGTKTTDNLTEGSSNLYMTTERVQDIVGGMVTGNTETGISVTYDDADGTLDFVVATLNQDTTGNAATATALETARTIGGVSFDGTGNIDLAGVNTTGNQDTTGNAATATTAGTVTTAAQPNITSLGTLTTLTVDDITIDDSTISDSGNLTVDVGGDIILDAGGDDITFKSGGTEFGSIFKSSNDLFLNSAIADGDIKFRGNDGGSFITALTLDMSAAGAATFNAGATFGGAITATQSSAATAATFKVGNNAAQVANLVVSNDADTGLNLGVFGSSAGTAGMISASDAFITTSTTELNVGVNNSSGVIKFGVGSTASEKMRIDGTGVGIGTSSPSTKLDVVGNIASTGVATPEFELVPTGSVGNADLKFDGTTFDIRSNSSSAALTLQTASTERMRILSGGNVGINTSTPTYLFNVLASSGSQNIFQAGQSGVSNGLSIVSDGSALTYSFLTGKVGIGDASPDNKLHINSGSDNINTKFESTDTEVRLQLKDSTGTSYIAARNDIRFGNDTSTERMRINVNGHILINTTANQGVGGYTFEKAGSGIVTHNNNDGASGGYEFSIFRRSSVQIGSIAQNGTTGIQLNTSSDARLKDVTGTARGLDVINNLNPVAYNWKSDNRADEGLIAQEVEKVMPNAVSQTKDGYYMMDYSKLVTPLVKAIQEQQEQIESLKSEIANLKGE